jgi:hypothetical protein
MAGWWLSPTPLKNMSPSVGMIIPNMMGKIKFMFQTTNQMGLSENEEPQFDS